METKNKTIFPAELIDEQKREEAHDFINTFVEELPAHLALLEDEGILDASDLNSVEVISAMSEADYIKHVQGLFKAYLSRIGFAPKGEKKRIADNFNAMMERTTKAVSWLHAYKERGFGFKMGKDGKAIADTEEAHNKADKDTATAVDTAELTAYYEQWARIAEAWKQLNEYERKHGLSETRPDSKLPFVYFVAGANNLGELTPTLLIRDFGKDTTPDRFFRLFANNFKK